MKVFLGLMIMSVCIGTIWDHKLPKQYALPTAIISILVMIAYFYFNKT